MPDATYLITGGLGGVGLELARWLAERGARHLVLLGRSGLDSSADAERKVASIRALEALGAAVEVVRADVSDRARMAELFRSFDSARAPLGGIFHAAGVIEPGLIPSLDAEGLRRMFGPKVRGAWILHELSAGLRLDCFVLFSSGASVWGSKGGGHYAAANHFLDALADYRRSIGLPALSVNWGRWGGRGMTNAEAASFFDEIGLLAMQPEQAFEALGFLMATRAAGKTVAAIDWKLFLPVYEARRRRPLLERIHAALSGGPAPATTRLSLALRLNEVPQIERWSLLVAEVRRTAAAVLGFDDPERLPVREGFFSMGMDSLTSVELKRRLEADLDRPLPTTVAFEYPTVEALAGYIRKEVLGLEDGDGREGGALVAEVERLSDEEAQRALVAALADLKRDLQ